jgi:hypothetical protein
MLIDDLDRAVDRLRSGMGEETLDGDQDLGSEHGEPEELDEDGWMPREPDEVPQYDPRRRALENGIDDRPPPRAEDYLDARGERRARRDPYRTNDQPQRYGDEPDLAREKYGRDDRRRSGVREAEAADYRSQQRRAPTIVEEPLD